MKSIYRFLSYISLVAFLTLSACSRSDIAKQPEGDEAKSEAAADMAQPQQQTITQQQPGGPPPVEVDANAPKPVDPSQLPMTPSNAPLPSMNAPQGTQQVGAPPSESPAGTPPGGTRAQNTAGRPISEQPVGGGMGEAELEARERMVETMLISQKGFENVKVDAGTDGCIHLTGKVATAEKKEEATALARGVVQGGCLMNRLEIGR